MLGDQIAEEVIRRIDYDFRKIKFRSGDAVSRLGVRMQKLNPAIRATGATLGWGIDDPRDVDDAELLGGVDPKRSQLGHNVGDWSGLIQHRH